MLFTVIALLAIGLAAGLLAGLLGIGGGLVIVPALTWLLLARDVPIELAVPAAVATSLGTMLLTALSAVWFHRRRGALAWEAVARLAPAVAVGGMAGAWLATVIPGETLARIFAAIAALIGLRMVFGAAARVGARTPYPRAWWLAGPLIGAVSAMVGIGGGTFNVPYLARNGYAMVRAVAVASACGWPLALGGAVMFAVRSPGAGLPEWSLGHLWLPAVAMIGVGGMLAAPGGVALAHHLPADRLRRLFGIALILVAVRMAW